MLRKNIAPVVATILSGLLFIVIGSCFSAFLYKDEIIKIENPKVIVNGGVSVYDKEGEKVVDAIEFSELKLGLKPVTGEIDKETNIPVTVTEKKGTEGQYGKVKVLAPQGAKIYITNVKIDKDNASEKTEEEKKNIMVAIKEIKQSSVTIDKEKVYLGDLNASEEKVDLTFYVWLSDKATEELKSATISFVVNFEA